tara:strand:+ start:1559 stop:2368 length:810 start_codon:yes stop_codon:yes gene_type:complete
MAEVTTTRTELPEFLEAAAKPYLTELTTAVGGLKGADLSKVYGPQFVAGQDPLSQQAVSIATGAQGLGSYQPFLQTAAARTGPDAYKDFMSPYQRDVISTALEDFDRQAARGVGALSDAAVQAGAFGGARQGVAEAEYMAQSDRNRAALQAQLLQQGFGQAQQAAGADFARQLSLAQSSPALAGQQISGLQTLGGAAQTQRQSELAAQQQLAQQQLLQPLQAAQALGGGITSLIAGYPTQQTTIAPSPSMAQTALSAGATLAGIYGALR